VLLVVSPRPDGIQRSWEPAQGSNPISITFGKPTSRELAAGAKETFEIWVNQDQLLLVSVVKGDLAMLATLYGPSGSKLLENSSHAYEVLEVSLHTDVAGKYKIQIESLERAQGAGEYELSVHTFTTAEAKWQKDLEARQLNAGARALSVNWTEASLLQAIERYDTATQIWIAAADLPRAARASLESGDVCFLLSRYHEALEHYQKAAELAAKLGDKLAQAEALSQIGKVYSYFGNNDRAKKHLTEALELFDKGKANQNAMGRYAFAKALSNLGEVYYSKGDLVKASAQFQRALQVFHELNDRCGEATAHLFSGYISGSLGQLEKAISEISQALDLFRAVNNKAGEGLSLTALGLSHSLRRDEDGAIGLHRAAIEIFRGIGDQHSEAIACTALGQAYENLSEYPIALANYKKALQLFQKNGALDLAAVAMFKIATMHQFLGKSDQALAFYQSCLRLSRAAGKIRTEANALNEVATIYASQGNRQKTLAQYRRIRKFYETTGDRPGEAVTLHSSGDFLLRLGDKQGALKAYTQSLTVSEEVGDKGLIISSLYNLARVQRDLGSLEVALSYIKKSLQMIEELRTSVGSPDFRASYFSGVRKHYDLCIEILMQLDHARPGQDFSAAALLASENGRARLIRDLLRESRADFRQGATPELIERERELRGLLRSQTQYGMELSMQSKDTAEITEVAAQVDQLRSEYQEVLAQLRDRNSRLLPLLESAPLSLEQIQGELLDPDTMLLEYALGDDRSYLWVVTPDALHSYELPARKIIEDSATRLYQSLTARQEFETEGVNDYQSKVEASDNLYFENAAELSEMLLRPVAEQLGNKRLVVVTEGALQYIPFDALPVPVASGAGASAVDAASTQARPLLLATNEIVGLPSVSTLVAIRSEKPHSISRNKIVAVVADPIFSGMDDRVRKETPGAAIELAHSVQHGDKSAREGLEARLRASGPGRLIHAEEEADAILSVAPRGTGMIASGFEASRETVMSSRISDYQIIHLVTHSFRDREHPELAGIVLTMVDRNGKAKDGLVPLHDIYGLHLSAELTVLSACETALGKDIKGEGLVGLTHSFMSAGSKSVVASLWKVDDRATAVLMTDFYESMLEKGMSPAAALRSAKLKLRQEKRWSSPYYWAGFVIQGEYKNRIEVAGNSWFRLGLLIVSALILIASALMFVHRRRSKSSFAAPPAGAAPLNKLTSFLHRKDDAEWREIQ